MFILTIQGSTPEEVKAKFDQWSEFLGLKQNYQITLAELAPQEVSNEPTPVIEDEKKSEAPKKRGRKAKAPSEAAQEPVAETAPTIAEASAEMPAPVTATKEEMEAALKSVFEQKGIQVATSVLAGFGFKRMSEVKEEKFGEVVEACKKALAA